MPYDSTTYQPPESQLLLDLRAARAMIADERRWCQHMFVFGDWDGERHCLVGAISAVTATDTGWDSLPPKSNVLRLRRAWKFLDSITAPDTAMVFNDSHTHGEVLALVDRAIERAGVQMEVAA